MQVKILGTKLEVNLFAPDVKERQEKCVEEVIRKVEASKNCEKDSEALRQQCSAVINCLDDFFGPGSAKAVFGEEADLLTCLDAFGEFCGLYDRYFTPEINKRIRAAQTGKK